MPRIVDSILMEFEQEAATTRRVLERVPGDKLDWKPHEKSMSLGQLGQHIASVPGDIASMAALDEVEVPDFGEPPSASSVEDLLSTHDEGVNKAREILNGMDDEAAMATWKATKGGRELMAVPRIGVVRSIMLNHWYHHRGQMSVYLRLLSVPVPSIYGPSADENPWE